MKNKKTLRAAVNQMIADCPYYIDPATVPKAGIDAAPPYQVVLQVSMSLTRYEELKELCGFKEEDHS